jgi:hypothetical protein
MEKASGIWRRILINASVPRFPFWGGKQGTDFPDGTVVLKC